ncbi:G-protein coupled receptor 62 [Ambystoma mexicanum]|uniref:G-protein coupled receptor 62 n=1 Tax=Ambystoma mexicanum TaxID=8296 RepID=UPI0037E881B4
MANESGLNASEELSLILPFSGASLLQDVLGTVFMVMLTLVALLANLAVLVVILKNPLLRKFVFVGHLCLIDLLSAVLLMPLGIVSNSSCFSVEQFSFMECQAFVFLNICFISASILTVSAISIERYYYIVHPMRYEVRMTLGLVVAVVVFIWMKAILFAGFSLLGWSPHTSAFGASRCSMYWSPSAYKSIFIIVFSVFCFVLPTFVIIAVYCSIYRVARMASLQHGPVPSWPASSRRRSDSLHSQVTIITTRNLPPRLSTDRILGGGKAAVTLMIIVGQYLLCWLPFFSFLLHFSINPPGVALRPGEIVVTWLAYSSFAINPFMYGFLNRQIREELSKLGQHCLNRPTSQEVSSQEGSVHENFLQFLQRTHSTMETRSSYVNYSPRNTLDRTITSFRIPGQIPEDTS